MTTHTILIEQRLADALKALQPFYMEDRDEHWGGLTPEYKAAIDGAEAALAAWVERGQAHEIPDHNLPTEGSSTTA